ncbi:hypothetical protein IGS59_20860 [Janthinobacterium sp. GW460P]|uniref:hypothetical protein n=1 Tax=unclassified Janthinobacterium TaxID=2610881 RepID=UPI00111C7B0B|nr:MULTISPECIES: hypothetical protein [unclassified Janthinobacterium]MCC7704697.1 hypothetical protein [Janthinobacterium sp. GW460P]MCC7710199.1 hypothetical protein [Janthinobacterium sp. GW460W]
MVKVKFISAVISLSALVGCGTSSNLKRDSEIHVDQSSSILLLKVSPQYRIHLLRGRIEEGVWVRPKLDVPEVNIIPESDGYIFVKLKINEENERLAVSLVFPGEKAYGPCEGSTGATFDLRANSITYVGELSYQFDGTTLKYQHKMDISDAQNYLISNYGTKLPKLEVVPMNPMTIKTTFCAPKGTVTIPIYIPRGR